MIFTQFVDFKTCFVRGTVRNKICAATFEGGPLYLPLSSPSLLLYIFQLIANAIGTGGVVMVAQPWKKDSGNHDYHCPLWVEYDANNTHIQMLLGYGLAVLAGMKVWHEQ